MIVKEKQALSSEPRVAAAAVGPILSRPVLWETRSRDCEQAAFGKNLPEQIPENEEDRVWVDRMSVAFLSALAAGQVDATGLKRQHLWPASPKEVVDAAYKKSGKKGRLYEAASAVVHKGKGIWEAGERWIGSMFVKFELLKEGKPPRNIFNSSTEDVVVVREAAMPMEHYMAETGFTFKGLVSEDKWIPICNAARAVDKDMDVWVVCLDDTARDGNTVEHDLKNFISILYLFGVMTQLVLSVMQRLAAKTRTKFFNLVLVLYSLLSGVPHTSLMNFWTSVFGLWCWAVDDLGLAHSEFAIVAEGDDTALIIAGRRARELSARGKFSECDIVTFGLRLRKRWKLEDCGPLDKDRGHPIVGGVVVENLKQFYYFPSWKRFILKAGWCGDYGLKGRKPYLLRASARACALVDRYSSVPVMWAYACKVAEAFGCSTAGMTREERFSYSGKTACLEPSSAARVAFEKAYGIAVCDQFALERLITTCTRYEDLTRNDMWVSLVGNIGGG